MRNIYEIIEEQKHMVDVNIAFYELEHINESYIYLTEGSGGGIVKKVIDFIKTIMRKIKELVQKVISLFTGGKSGGGSSSSPKKKRYIPKEDLDKEVKIPYMYKASHFEDSFEQGVELLLELIESHTDDLDNKLLDDKLKDLYDSFGEHDSVNEVIKQTFNCDINDEGNKLRTLRSVEEKLLTYVNEGDVVATCKKMNKWAQDALNKLLRSVNDDAEKTKVVQHASQLVNLMSQSFLKAIVNSRKIAMQYTVEEGSTPNSAKINPKNKAALDEMLKDADINDMDSIRNKLTILIQNDRNFKKGYYKDALTILKSKGLKIQDLIENEDNERPLITEDKKSGYTEDDYVDAIFNLKKCFSNARLKEVEKIGKALYPND